jgi:hypothetical protein
MIILLFVISAAILALGIVGLEYWDWDEFGYGVGAAGLSCGIVCILAALVLSIKASGSIVIDKRIQMYTEENAKIEEQIATVVAQYQEYEHDIITEVAPDSSVTLVSLYPDLKSDTLVQSQIAVYLSNNEAIKQLKNDAICASVYRWWLYFGK